MTDGTLITRSEKPLSYHETWQALALLHAFYEVEYDVFYDQQEEFIQKFFYKLVVGDVNPKLGEALEEECGIGRQIVDDGFLIFAEQARAARMYNSTRFQMRMRSGPEQEKKRLNA
ncbi:unnamed protein product [Haemonchus placei]|uniref:Nicotinate phosphoribosyltransferase n=1 Tax=Haemonchus placei TaxID=6290 RepID=A0A0N4WHJ2_HAEPC|nr:unnamed protein product [Haemonchus placei]